MTMHLGISKRMESAVFVFSVALLYPTASYSATAAMISQGGQINPPADDSLHGWRFSPNESIVVSHLGLFDNLNDGFNSDHEIGIFDYASGTLLVSAFLNAGTGDLLVDNFRYTEISGTLLEADTEYIVAFHASEEDLMVIDNPVSLSFDPGITYLSSSWSEGSGSLDMPVNQGGTFPYRFGPNFQFDTIPEPSSLAFLLLMAPSLLKRRRHRTS